MAADSLGTLTVDMIANTGGFERGMGRAERALKSATKEAKFQQQQLEKLVGQIDPMVAAYGRLDKMEQQLRDHRKAGRLDEFDFQAYTAQLNEQRAALAATDKVMSKNGLSAKALAANLRGIPAQFTDIAVSLQAGQSPLTVLLQQGGQLKDMFGGIGPAARALGGYVLGLVNPFTIAAAAAIALAIAFKQGSDESVQFQKAIILSGNASGVTADQLQQMAAAVSEVGGTQGQASDVLAAVAASGKFAVDEITEVSKAAIALERSVGIPVDKTIKEFERLADDPVRASEALNKQYNYLTASVYSQIVALEAQGKTIDAGRLAIEAYAKTTLDRGNEVKENLSGISKGWQGIKDAAAHAWDSMLDVGREKTLQDKIDDLGKLENKQGFAFNAAAIVSGGFGVAQPDDIQLGDNKDIEAEKQKLALLQQQRAEEAKLTAQRAADTRLAIDAQSKIDELTKGALTNEEKRNKEIANYRRLLDAVRKASPDDARLNQSAIDKNIENINAKYKDPAVKEFRETAGVKLLDDYRKQFAVLQQQAAIVDEQTKSGRTLGDEAKKLAAFEQEISDIKSKGQLTADQKSILSNQDLLRAQLKRNVLLEQEIALRKQAVEETAALATFQEQLNQQLQVAQRANDADLTGRNTSDEAARRAKELITIQQKYADDQFKLQSQLNKGSISEGLYAQETGLLKDALEERLKLQQDYYEKLDAAQQDASAGFEKGLANFYESQKQIAAEVSQNVQSTLQTLEDGAAESLVAAARHGDSLRDSLQRVGDTVVDSVLTSLIKIGIQQTLNAALGQSLSASAFAATTAESVAAASVTGSAWAAPAALVSLATFGENAAAASAALAGTVALSKSLSLTGFEQGGYTGDMGTKNIAGVVHGKEFVFDAASTQRIGKGNLEAMRSGAQPRSGGGNNLTVNNPIFPNARTAREGRSAAGAMMREIYRRVQSGARYS